MKHGVWQCGRFPCVLSWQVKFEQSSSALVCQAMEVVGAYISWIDITLVANDRFVR